MEKYGGPMINQRGGIPGLWLFAGLAAVLLALTPREETLGYYLKVVYVHATTTWVGIAAFTVAGLAGLWYLLTGHEKWYRWCLAARRTALVFWIIAVLSELVAMRLIWGAFLWEPRLPMTLQVLLLAVALHLITGAIDGRRLIAALNLGLAALLWFLLATTRQVMHPNNPIGRSGSLTIKLTFLAVLLSLLAAAFCLARGYYLYYKWQK